MLHTQVVVEVVLNLMVDQVQIILQEVVVALVVEEMD
jgi:hypothetical protein